MFRVIAPFMALLATACAHQAAPSVGPMPQHDDVAAILEKHEVQAAAIGVMRDHELVFDHYAGIERPDHPVTPQTRFKVASISKTVAAETFLRMVAAGDAALDAPLSQWWVDPDVAEDPRVHTLTARHVLTHTSGFPNWRFFTDGKLLFQNDPGTAYGYSGEGFQYLFRAMEQKTGQTYPQLVDTYVFDPLGIENAVPSVDDGQRDDIVWSETPDGRWVGPDCRPEFCWEDGDWSAAGGLKISLRDYAKILGSITRRDGYGEAIARQRDAIVTDRGRASSVNCALAPTACPDGQGYGLGFKRIDRGGLSLIGHEGEDWSQLTLAFADRNSGDGLIIFLAGSGDKITLMRDLVTALAPGTPWDTRYRQWVERRQND